MAKAPDRKTTSRLRSRLASGYDSLTLDPAPALRRMQQELSRPSEKAMQSAWMNVGSAVANAMKSTGEGLRAGQSS